jgi:hypothetical protein
MSPPDDSPNGGPNIARDLTTIHIEALDPDTMALWRAVAKIATELGEDSRWCLVGGLMVALFAIEAEQTQRPTTDIDLLGDARRRPSATEWLATRLLRLGADLHEISGTSHERGFRFELDGQLVDVLASDGLGRPAITTGKLQTIQIPGGTQALSRTEIVQIVVDDNTVTLRRPMLVAAILLKARALPVHSQPEDQRYDLVILLALLDDPREARKQLSKSEIGWLRRIADRLSLDDEALGELFDAYRLRAARAAYRVLTA